jgi:hypothetical protein
MRGTAVGLIGLATLCALTGCSPAINATAAIGYDEQGRLIGAVKVCDRDTVEGWLVAREGGQRDTSTWERSAPLTRGAETWPLRGRPGGRWESTGAAVPALGPAVEYQFGTSDEKGTYVSSAIVFHGRDLMRLQPGELLVERHSPPDKHGNTTTTLEAITLDDLADEHCGF